MVQDFVPIVHKVSFLHLVSVTHILFHCVCGVCVGVCACFRALAYYRGIRNPLPSLLLACGFHIAAICVCASRDSWLAVPLHMQPFLLSSSVWEQLKGEVVGKAESAILHHHILILKMYIYCTPTFLELCLSSCSFSIPSH